MIIVDIRLIESLIKFATNPKFFEISITLFKYITEGQPLFDVFHLYFFGELLQLRLNFFLVACENEEVRKHLGVEAPDFLHQVCRNNMLFRFEPDQVVYDAVVHLLEPLFFTSLYSINSHVAMSSWRHYSDFWRSSAASSAT
jgi:hypothetical protein